MTKGILKGKGQKRLCATIVGKGAFGADKEAAGKRPSLFCERRKRNNAKVEKEDPRATKGRGPR